MKKSTIGIEILLDPNKMPEQISWEASDSNAEMKQRAKNNQQLRAYVKSIEKANRTRTTIF